MDQGNTVEIQEKIRRLEDLEQLKSQIEDADKSGQKKNLIKNLLLVLLAILCCITVFHNVYTQNEFRRVKRDIMVMEEDIRSIASEVRTMQGE